jgi:hypothetical protein
MRDNRRRCVNYFTLRTVIILMETIKELDNQPGPRPPSAPLQKKPRLWLGMRGGAEDQSIQRHSRKRGFRANATRGEEKAED